MAKEQLAGSKELRLDLLEMNSGIYFLYDDDELVYIGQAYNITRRITDHILEATKKFNNVRYNLVPKELLTEVETTLIKALKPKYNVAGINGNVRCETKETRSSIISIRPVVLPHHMKRDGTINVKIRVTYKRKSFFISTNFFVYLEQIEKSWIKDERVLADLEHILKKIRNSVKYITPDKSYEYVRKKVLEIRL